MRPDTEWRLILALSLNPGATSRQIAAQLEWEPRLTSIRLGRLHHQGTAWRDRVRHVPRSGDNGRVEYRYWLFKMSAAPEIAPAAEPPAAAVQDFPHWNIPAPRNEIAAGVRCRRLANEADVLMDAENER